MRRIVFVVIAVFACTSLYGKTEFGTLLGAQFRIDVPDNWNHGLVVYYHGYDPHDHGSVFAEQQPLQPQLAAFTHAGYAVIQSGYSRGGWALEQAIPETEGLRQYFIEHFGKPSETYVAGASMGGMLTVMTLEQSPENYAAGLDLCGAVSNAPALLGRAFDLRVLFDYYFPGVLSNPARVPQSYQISDELGKKIAARVQGKPIAAAALRRFGGLNNSQDLVSDILFATWVLKDIEQRAGGNPFDNRNTIYAGLGNDNAVNDGVKRYAADPGTLKYLQRFYTPTGHLTRPVLAIHTTYDQLVPPSVPGDYALLARQAGSGNLFVVQYVEHDGHCNFTPDEIERAFTELRQWKGKGIAPVPGRLQ